MFSQSKGRASRPTYTKINKMIAIAMDANARISVSAARSRSCLRLRCRFVMPEMRSNSDMVWLLRIGSLAAQGIKTLLGYYFLTLRTENPIHQSLSRAFRLARRVPIKLPANRIRAVQHICHAGLNRHARIFCNRQSFNIFGIADSTVADTALILCHRIHDGTCSRQRLILRSEVLVSEDVFLEI